MLFPAHSEQVSYSLSIPAGKTPYMRFAFSLERIQQYLDIEHEPALRERTMPPAYWPVSSELRVMVLSARYAQVSHRARASCILVCVESGDQDRACRAAAKARACTTTSRRTLDQPDTRCN